MESTRQRIRYFIEYQGIKPKDFLNITGQKRGLLDKSLVSHGVTDSVIAQILESYPELSPMWLISGQGEMLNTGHIEKSIEEFENESNAGRAEEETFDYLEALKSGELPDQDRESLVDKVKKLLAAKTKEISILKTELLDLYRKIQKLES